MGTEDLLRARLDQMTDMCHPLAVLVTRMPWAEIEASLEPLFAHRSRPGRTVTDADLFLASPTRGRHRLLLDTVRDIAAGPGQLTS